MAEAVYAIEDFPDDDLLWRIEWIRGVGYNTSVPCDPQIEIRLAQLPAGETNPFSARSRSSQTKRTVRIAVGLLPYISIASVMADRRPVIKDLAASRHRLCIDTSLCRTVALAELANAIPRSSYLFGVSWPDVHRTLLVAVEQNGDPYAVMIPTLEVIRFYHAPSTRLAQALFWGEYNETFSAGRSGVFEEGVVKVHLCLGSRLLPPSKRSFRRKTERRSARSEGRKSKGATVLATLIGRSKSLCHEDTP
jgi:hypothetical protein